MAVTVGKDKPTAHITGLLRKELMEIDEESGLTKDILVAKNIVDYATGKKGGGREQLSAIATVFERIDGKVREEINNNFFNDYPKQDKEVLAKYAYQKKVEGKDEFDFDIPENLQ